MIHKIFSVFLTLLFFSCGESNQDKSVNQIYPMPWRDTQGNEIATIGRALVKNNVKVCGQYVVRPSAQYKGEYLVACTPDGQKYVYFLVWVDTEVVNGPFDDVTVETPQ